MTSNGLERIAEGVTLDLAWNELPVMWGMGLQNKISSHQQAIHLSTHIKDANYQAAMEEEPGTGYA